MRISLRWTCSCLGVLFLGCGGPVPADGEPGAVRQLAERAPPRGLSSDAARALHGLGPAVWASADEGAVVSLFGPSLGSVRLRDALDVEEAEGAARRFLEAHRNLYGVALEQLAPDALVLDALRRTDRLSFDLQQRHAGLEVSQGRLVVSFDAGGRLRSIVGRLVPQGELPVVLSPTLSAAEAGARAMEDAGPGATLEAPRLRIDVARGLVYDARVLDRDQDDVHVVDASTGEVLAIDSQIAHLEPERIPLRYYHHPSGSRTATNRAYASFEVDVPTSYSSSGRYCLYRLERDGAAGVRIWNAKDITSLSTPFPRPQFLRRCGDDAGLFDVLPGASSDDRFNLQQTYVWTERFAGHVDSWGRAPNRYGRYPVDAGREVPVEVVVNAHPGRESTWCGSSVQHGCFRRSVDVSDFLYHPQSSGTVPVVYLFSQYYNRNSRHFVGPEHSPTYAIVAHEVGHFVTWTYGGFRTPSGSGGVYRRTLTEGFSMVYPALMGMERWPSTVRVDDVATGRQWRDPFDPANTNARYSDLSCGADPYDLAEPFVQAMWRLMNNRAMDGSRIWATDAQARAAVADRLMHAVFTHGNNTQATWVTIAFDVLTRTSEAIYTDGTDVEATSGQALQQILEVLNAHGLLSACVPYV